MVIVQRHLIDLAERTPVCEMTDKSRQPRNSLRLDFLEGKIDVLLG